MGSSVLVNYYYYIVIITNNHEGLQELITAENTEKIKCLRPKQTKTPTLWSLAFLRRYAQ